MYGPRYIEAFAFAVSAALTKANPLLTGRTTCSTDFGSGTCVSTSSCAGFSIAGHCPGSTNIQCCITEKSCSTSSGSGTCLNRSNGCSGGKFVAGACPGPSGVQCCVKTGSSGGGGNSGGSGDVPAGSPVNAATLELIESVEGFRANYYDINGDKTIGFGHDCTQKQDCENIKEPLSKAQGAELLAKDIKDYSPCVCDLPNASMLNANQYGALVSFTYNSGCGGVSRDFKSYMTKGDYTGICEDLPSTNTLDGLLTSRREKEAALCSKATSEKSSC